MIAAVGFEVIGDNQFKITYNSPILQDQILDYRNVPKAQQPGQMRRLLCAAAVGCFAGSVYDALKARGVSIKSQTAKSTAITGNGPLKRIQKIDIVVEVEIEDKDIETLEEVKKLLEKGSLVTRSIEPSITVSRTIVRKER